MTQPPTPQWDPQAGRWVLPDQGAPQGYGGPPQGQHGQADGQQAWQGQQPPGHASPGQGYAQPSGQWPPQPPRAPAKKRRKWPFVVGGLVLLIIILASTSGGETPTPTQAGGSVPATTAAPATGAAPAAGADAEESTTAASSGVVYTVTGSGKSNNITYGGLSKGISQENGKRLPWTKTVPSTEGFESYSVTAQNGGGDGEISCKITVDGEEIANNTSSGQYAVVSCSGTNSPF